MPTNIEYLIGNRIFLQTQFSFSILLFPFSILLVFPRRCFSLWEFAAEKQRDDPSSHLITWPHIIFVLIDIVNRSDGILPLPTSFKLSKLWLIINTSRKWMNWVSLNLSKWVTTKNPDLPLKKSTPAKNPHPQKIHPPFFTSIHKMGPPAFHSHHSWFLIMSASFHTHLF